MLEKQIEYIRSITDFIPDIAVVLGSGFGRVAESVKTEAIIKYSDIEGFPVSTLDNHKGRFVFGYIADKKVAIMDGRVHLYEGYSPQECVLPIRLLHLLGCKTVIFTNAAGGINKGLEVGDFMIINDHISSFVDSPLIGKNIDSLGTRFPDMNRVYDKEISNLIFETAKEYSIPIKSGVYAQLKGPQFETPAEIKMLSAVGCDAVGMSTVIEVIAARHCNMKIAGISLITNLACGILDQPITNDEVKQTAALRINEFTKLLTETLRKL